MKITLAYICFLIFSPVICAQELVDRIIYLDSVFRETNQFNQSYYRVIHDFYKNRQTYKITDYYKSGKIYAEGYTTDNRNLVKTGEFVSYFENGNQKEKINYEKSAPIGPYSSWYENGDKELEGEYLLAEKEGDKNSALRIDQYWDPKNM
ncbi:MAG TPA: hypothetical protein VK528_05715 [Flavobacterium sp.]|nr:hypothetical protein [Flavobacterium sp.]